MPTLHWLNDVEARKTSSQIPYRLLEADPKLSYGVSDSENMLIQGDNLEALKALLPYYAGQVKCIYIDPPFNTQNAFEHYDDNLEHSIWLSIMYPRMEILRELLASEGFLFVQIDYREGARLKILLDEIFGVSSFRNEIIVRRGTKNVQSQFETIEALSTGHDSIFLYANNQKVRLPKLQKLSEDSEPGKWDTFWRGTDRPTMRYNLFGIKPDKGQWRWAEQRALQAKRNYEIYLDEYSHNMTLDDYYGLQFQENGTDLDFVRLSPENVVQYYVPPRNYKILSDVWMDVRTSGKFTDFSHEKHEELLERIIRWVTQKGDIVLDSFLGSGSTAAVAHKMGRRYIGIEMGDHAVTFCAPRLQNVIEGEQSGISKEINWQGGGGFHFYRLGETIFDEQGHINEKVKFKPLAAHVWFSETHTPLLKTPKTPLLGVHNETAYYLLYNGILGDTDPKGGNVLIPKILRQLPKHKGKKVIYGEMSMLEESVLQKEEITFKHIPYDIKAR